MGDFTHEEKVLGRMDRQAKALEAIRDMLRNVFYVLCALLGIAIGTVGKLQGWL